MKVSKGKRSESRKPNQTNLRRRIGRFETLESRILFSASSIGGRPYIELGPSDYLAPSQPKGPVELSTAQGVSIGPEYSNDFLFDTGANTILAFKDAVDQMKTAVPAYVTDGRFQELGVGGYQFYDISQPYQFDYAGYSGERNTLPNTRIISDPTRNLSDFGPDGILGMPGYTGKVSSFDFVPLSDFDNVHVEFGNTMPTTTIPRYSFAVDDRITFLAEPNVISGPAPPAWSDIPFLTGQLVNNNSVVTGNMVFDTGAQVSILSSEKAFELGLDTNQDGLLDLKDANYAFDEAVSGIGGTETVPVFLIDQLHVTTQQGPDLVWTDMKMLILDIYPGIDGIFGFDNSTAGWIEALFGVTPAGFISQSHLDFRNWETSGQGSVVYDINPNIFAVVDPNGPGATVNESGDITSVSESGVTDTYQIALNVQPTANVRVNFVSGLASSFAGGGNELRAASQVNPANTFVDFTPSNWNIPQTVVVSSIDNSAVEGFRRSYIKHVSTSADARYQNVGMPRVTANIVDNDSPGVMIIQTDGSTNVTEGGNTDTYQLVLTYPPTQPVTIQLDNTLNQATAVAAVGGAKSLVFTTSNWSVPQTVVVTAVDDSRVEGPHKTYVSHTVSSNDSSLLIPSYDGSFAMQETVFITDNDVTQDTIPPRILDVIAGSSQWTTGFIDAVDGAGVGTGNKLGLSLPGASQLKNLPQNNINKLYVKFSENVSASFSSAKVSLIGTNLADYMATATVVYGVDGADIATITFSSPIANDALRLSILDTLTDAAGNRLDGEWTDGSSASSGNGNSTGQFNFRIDVLPGDVNDSNGVNSTDLLATHGMNGTVNSKIADAYFDINGNGSVNSTDLLLAYSLNGSVLPAAPGGSSLLASGKSDGGRRSGWSNTLGTLSKESASLRRLDFMSEQRSRRARESPNLLNSTSGDEFSAIARLSQIPVFDPSSSDSREEFLVMPDYAFSFKNSQLISESWCLSEAEVLSLRSEMNNLSAGLDQSNPSNPRRADFRFFDASTTMKRASKLIVDQLIIEIADYLDDLLPISPL